MKVEDLALVSRSAGRALSVDWGGTTFVPNELQGGARVSSRQHLKGEGERERLGEASVC